MSFTHLRQQHTLATQQIAPFTGEGAYHGSTRKRAPRPASVPKPVIVDEMRPTTLDAYPLDGPLQGSFVVPFTDELNVYLTPQPDGTLHVDDIISQERLDQAAEQLERLGKG